MACTLQQGLQKQLNLKLGTGMLHQGLTVLATHKNYEDPTAIA